jgi:hypothetical protein
VVLGRGDLPTLVKIVAETREIEIGCDECFEQLDNFAEAELSGMRVTAVMPLVDDHLHKCADCRSTFEALLTALRST